MIQYHVFMIFEDTLVNSVSLRRVLNHPTESAENPINADRVFIHTGMVNLIKRFSKDFSFVIFYRYTKKAIVEKIFEKCHFPPNIQLTYTGDNFGPRIVIPSLNTTDKHYLFFICGKKHLQEIQQDLVFQQYLDEHDNVILRHILPCYFEPSWRCFARHTELYSATNEQAYLFSSNIASLSNYFAFILNKPMKTLFLQRSTLNEDQARSLLRKHPDRTKDLYLFDYYRSSADSLTKEKFSQQFISKIKNGTSIDIMSILFCEAILNHLIKSGIDLRRCLFLIYPSSTENQWNPVLMQSMQHVLKKHGQSHITLQYLRRIRTVPKQHLSDNRNEQTQINSIQLEVPDLSAYSYAVILDDLTSYGTSFNAASVLLRKNGFNGFIQPFAIGGTQYSKDKTTEYRLPLDPDQREEAPNGYIFDLDNTILETDIALEDRQNGDWRSACRKIPEMKPYPLILDAIRRLIQKGIDVAIVTSSVRMYTQRILQHFDIFPDDLVCVSYHDTKRHKPDPDPYLVAERQMKHMNRNIFCIGDRLHDMVACDEANKARPGTTFIPLLAYWQTTSWQLIPETQAHLKVFTSELQFINFLGFILPARITLDELIQNYLRPVFNDQPFTDLQIYDLLTEKGYLEHPGPSIYTTTEKGKTIGLSGSVSPLTHRQGQKGNIHCNYHSQFEIIQICQTIDYIIWGHTGQN